MAQPIITKASKKKKRPSDDDDDDDVGEPVAVPAPKAAELDSSGSSGGSSKRAKTLGEDEPKAYAPAIPPHLVVNASVAIDAQDSRCRLCRTRRLPPATPRRCATKWLCPQTTRSNPWPTMLYVLCTSSSTLLLICSLATSPRKSRRASTRSPSIPSRSGRLRASSVASLSLCRHTRPPARLSLPSTPSPCRSRTSSV